MKANVVQKLFSRNTHWSDRPGGTYFAVEYWWSWQLALGFQYQESFGHHYTLLLPFITISVVYCSEG